MATSITLDVFCETTQNGTPAYRVYVDDDLLTERSWRWPSYEVFIREHIEVDLEPGAHLVKIESCGAASSFIFQNFKVNGAYHNAQDLRFTV